ncbi:TolC family protein [Flavobacterium tegetincola]|uniref:TolC family protein n=1 Tax=Flavobacterium tegetincola TaxID=150172 RepID=UPI000416EF5A|nr:TolC family protein [Flavobacterium tegetincola]
MNAKYLTLFLLTFFVFTQVKAQDTIGISKETVLKKVTEGNLQIKISQHDFKASQAEYRQSSAVFLPNITVSHTGISTTNPLMAFGSKLNQEILTQNDFNPSLLNNPDVIQNFATKIEVLQPILNFDGFAQRQAARIKAQSYKLQSERTEEAMLLDAKKSYMELQLAYQSVQVLEKALQTAKENGRMVDNFSKQGLVQKTDVLSVEIRINEIKNQLQMAKSAVRNSSDYIGYLVNNEEKNVIYKPLDAFELDENAATEATSLSNRKDFQAMALSTEAYGKMVSASKMSFLPRLNAFGSYELYDKNIFGTSAKGYVIGAQLSWNIFDGYKSIGKLQQAKIVFEKAQTEEFQYKAKSELELNKFNRQLLDAKEKVNLAQLNVNQSTEAYRIRQNRFEQGLEKTADVLISEMQKIQKELEYKQAVFEYNFTKEYVTFLSK